jgi:hypothetical protein
LTATFHTHSKDHLPFTCQVVRTRDGASIPRPEQLVPKSTYTQRRRIAALEMRTFLMAAHERMGKHSPAKVLAATAGVQRTIYLFLKPKQLNKALSACAHDHFDVVSNLTKAQLAARYPAACAERWGQGGGGHPWEGDGEAGIPLRKLLRESQEPCGECGGDGEQFFSFCLNRPVNGDRVQHCHFCGKCFYYRPGCIQGCAHCGWAWEFPPVDWDHVQRCTGWTTAQIEAQRKRCRERGEDFSIQHLPAGRGCNVPPWAWPETRGLARYVRASVSQSHLVLRLPSPWCPSPSPPPSTCCSEGYWGF